MAMSPHQDFGMSALEGRLASLETNGFKIVPKTTNPAPLGLYAFGLATGLLMGVYAELIEPEAVGICCALAFFLGLAMILVSLSEYQRGNLFGLTVFGTFGPFWMALSTYLTLVSLEVFSPAPKGVAMLLILFGVVAFLFWLTTFSLNAVISLLLLSLSVLLFCLAGGQTHPSVLKPAGCFGLFVAALAFYAASAGMLAEMYGFNVLPVFALPPINSYATGRLGGFGTRKRVDTPADAEDKA